MFKLKNNNVKTEQLACQTHHMVGKAVRETIKKIAKTDALIVYMVDGLDLEGTLVDDINKLLEIFNKYWESNKIDNEEDKIAQNLNKTDIVTKIGPTLGLMGTLIPMGPGLAALGTGDVTTLASAITIAFNTTVIGIGSGAIAYFASKLRRRWFGEYLANLDALMDAILDNIDKRDDRLK